MAIAEKTLPPGHCLVGVLLAELADLHRCTGELAESELLYQRAIPVLEKSLGASDYSLAEALTSYSKVLRKLKRKKEASVLEERARLIREQQTLQRGPLTVDIRELGRR